MLLGWYGMHTAHISRSSVAEQPVCAHVLRFLRKDLAIKHLLKRRLDAGSTEIALFYREELDREGL